jgi:hypothetical protein
MPRHALVYSLFGYFVLYWFGPDMMCGVTVSLMYLLYYDF